MIMVSLYIHEALEQVAHRAIRMIVMVNCIVNSIKMIRHSISMVRHEGAGVLVSRSSLPHVNSIVKRVEFSREVVVSAFGSFSLVVSVVMTGVMSMVISIVSIVVGHMSSIIRSRFVAMMFGLNSFMVVTVVLFGNIFVLSNSQRSVTLRISVVSTGGSSFSSSLYIVVVVVVIVA